ncbi:SelR domain-containing protein [Baffinella frigidus]|nr:SelR domain-containing protein [Cryptophyta sp. CCMP2293]
MHKALKGLVIGGCVLSAKAFVPPSASLLARRASPLFSSLGAAAVLAPRAISSTPSHRMSVEKSEEEWRTVLSKEQFKVLRGKGTESAGSSEYNKQYPKDGSYGCVGCGAPLYKASAKFDSGCGWPAFYEGYDGAIKEVKDKDGRRIEILCNSCGGHLGHVFKGEGFKNPVDARHCVNGICLTYKDASGVAVPKKESTGGGGCQLS